MAACPPSPAGGEAMGREPCRGRGLGAGSLEPLPPPRLLPPALGLSPSSDSQVVDLGSACSAGMQLLSQSSFCPVSRWPGSQGFFSKLGWGGAACLVTGPFPPPSLPPPRRPQDRVQNSTKSQGVTKPGSSLEWIPSVQLEVGLVWV